MNERQQKQKAYMEKRKAAAELDRRLGKIGIWFAVFLCFYGSFFGVATFIAKKSNDVVEVVSDVAGSRKSIETIENNNDNWRWVNKTAQYDGALGVLTHIPGWTIMLNTWSSFSQSNDGSEVSITMTFTKKDYDSPIKFVINDLALEYQGEVVRPSRVSDGLTGFDNISDTQTITVVYDLPGDRDPMGSLILLFDPSGTIDVSAGIVKWPLT